jgi:PTS system mannose-specific IIA component
MDLRRQDIRNSIASVDQGDGVVVLTDMYGGTPSNLAMQMVEKDKPIEVLAGVNLPLLVKLAKIRGSEPLHEALDHAKAAGRKYIALARDVVSAKPNGSAKE